MRSHFPLQLCSDAICVKLLWSRSWLCAWLLCPNTPIYIHFFWTIISVVCAILSKKKISSNKHSERTDKTRSLQYNFELILSIVIQRYLNLLWYPVCQTWMTGTKILVSSTFHGNKKLKQWNMILLILLKLFYLHMHPIDQHHQYQQQWNLQCHLLLPFHSLPQTLLQALAPTKRKQKIRMQNNILRMILMGDKVTKIIVTLSSRTDDYYSKASADYCNIV